MNKKENEEVRYLGEKAVSGITNIPVQTLRNFRCQGKGIPYSKFGRSVRYRLQDVLEFMESHRIETAPVLIGGANDEGCWRGANDGTRSTKGGILHEPRLLSSADRRTHNVRAWSYRYPHPAFQTQGFTVDDSGR